MEEYLSNLLKNKLDKEILKSVRIQLEKANKRIKLKVNKLNLNKKNYLRTFSKGFELLEKLIPRILLQKMKAHTSDDIDTSNYEQVVAKAKSEKKFRKELFYLEKEGQKIKELKESINLQLINAENSIKEQTKKKTKLENLQKKAIQRHEELLKQKLNLSQSPVLPRPKHLEMEEAYKFNIEIPELVRARAELARKKQLLEPLSKEKLIDHEKRYLSIIKEAKKKREAKLADHAIDNRINSITCLKKADLNEKQELYLMKRNMSEKRKNYGDLVRELFAPCHETKSPKSVLKNKKIITSTTSERNYKEAESLIVLKPRIKKVIKKPESVSPTSIRDFKKIDYLLEFRNKRSLIEDKSTVEDLFEKFSEKSLNGNSPEKLKKLQGFEKKLNHEEQRLRVTDHNIQYGLMFEEKANDFLLESIKAKMSMLGEAKFN